MAKASDAAPASGKKRRFSQIKEVFGLARGADPLIGWKMIGIVVGITALGAGVGAIWSMPLYGAFLTFFAGVLLAMLLLGRTAEKAAFAQLEGRPGAAGAALGTLKRGWSYDQQPVALDAGRGGSIEGAAMVYRAVGRAGVVLIGEGPLGRAQKLLTSERRKVQRIVPNVPITQYRLGKGSDDDIVGPKAMLSAMRKLPKTITKSEVTAVDQRLRSLSGIKPPIPPGVDPQKARHMRPPRQ